MMNVDEYQRWRDDPLTVKYHQFLRDYRLSLMEKWAVGALKDEELLAMGRCQMAADLTELDDDFIASFYRQSPKEEKGSDDVREDQATGR
jgi:hypothetical protein